MENKMDKLIGFVIGVILGLILISWVI